MSDSAGWVAKHWPAVSGGLVLIGGAVGWFVNVWHMGRKLNMDQTNALMDRFEEQLGKLDGQVAARDKQIEHLMTERQQTAEQLLRANLALADKSTPPVSVLKAMIDRDVGLMYLKRREGERDFVIIRVSSAYAQEFVGGSVYEFDGKRDAEIWPEDVAAVYAENDERIFRFQLGEFIEERVHSLRTGARGVVRGRKFPIHLHDGQDYIVGIVEFVPDPEPESG